MPFHLPKDQRKTAVIAGIIGNVMEWYDFALYGFMASILSTLFFPEGNRLASLLATYGIFAAGFIMRPLGSALFGWLGDTLGRTRVMMISVIMMTFPTAVLGCLPSYEAAGIWAPIGLVAVRLIQGLSVGGEFSSSVTYLVETAPRQRRGLSGSWANVGSMGGMVIGSGAATLVTSVFSEQVVRDWAWRLPFLFAVVLGTTAILLRRHLPHSTHFQKHADKHKNASPIRQAMTTNRMATLQGILFASGYGAVFYVSLVYIPTWVKEYVGSGGETALQFNTVAIVLVIFLVPLAAYLSDRLIRRTHLLIIGFAAQLLLAVPLFLWMSGGARVSIAVAQIIAGALIALPCGIAPALFVELFPVNDRLSGYSIAFNLGLGVVGGSTPMVSTWLIDVLGTELAPAFYLIAWALVAIGALVWMKDRSREQLR